MRSCQPAFSAALIGHVEAAYEDESEKNELCTPVPYPDTHIGWLRVKLQDLINTGRRSQDPNLVAWQNSSRLDAYSAAGQFEGEPAEDQMKILAHIGQQAEGAIANLEKLLEDLPDDLI